MSTLAYEVNFEGFVGLTHCFGGLSLGNLASMQHATQVSNPKLAALQVLSKMQFLSSLGIRQAILPPHERPHLPTIQSWGFKGKKEVIFRRLAAEASWLIPHVSSSASMWAANAGTISPSIDSSDLHLHFTPANLATYLHRAIEPETTSRIFKAIFPNPVFFTHHEPLLPGDIFRDEGSANHIRFCKTPGGPGVQLFVFGQIMAPDEFAPLKPKKYPARQTREASQAIARLHALYPGHMVFAHQNPDAIDAGVFHNDLICIGNQNILIVHEKAFLDQSSVIETLKRTVQKVCDTDLIVITALESKLPLQEAVQSYFFNSQLVSMPDGSMSLIAPVECQRFASVVQFMKELTEDPKTPIASTHFVDLSESMANGGGPGCLCLRITLTDTELAEINANVLFTDKLHERLVQYVHKFYPTKLTLQDLEDPALHDKNCIALEELTEILHLGKIYPFQLI